MKHAGFLLKVLVISLFAILASGQTSKACEIDIEILKGEKEVYEAGDIIIVKVKVTLTHRSCPVAIKQTKFTMEGMEVEGATNWEQKSQMVWERKLKIKITSNESGEVGINAIRTCDKDGGYGSLRLEAKAD
ncbi:MAG: hypothetical protein U9N51_02090 [Bacteroidota bacterium]|nr:hypothetical protein [Bacteroidota bacterium]